MATCLIGLGSNLGDRPAIIDRACCSLQAAVGELRARSSLHATRSVGGPEGQPEFCNAAALVETGQTPEQVLASLCTIEQQLGRQRAQRWGARSIDLDLLLYEQSSIETVTLVVPHPRMAFRRFVLAPAVEIAPAMVHPPTGFTVRELLARLAVRPIHIAVLGEQATVVGRAAAAHGGDCFLERTSFAETGTPSHGETFDRLHRVRDIWQRIATEANRPIISDFWIGEWLVDERSTRPREAESSLEGDRWQETVASLPEQLAAPHLVIWLQSASWPVPVDRASLRRAVWRPRQFPVLNLSGASFKTAVAETTAAVQAME